MNKVTFAFLALSVVACTKLVDRRHSYAINATDVMWQFFKAHPMP